MNIGMTYDLRSDYLKEGYTEEETAEFDRESTIEAIEQAIKVNGHTPHRIGHARALVQALARGECWDLVFNIAEGLKGLARESQVPSILDVYGIPYTFSDPFVMAICLHKGVAKAIVRDQGVPTPDYFVVERSVDVGKIAMKFPLFAKPVAEGTGKGITHASVIRDRKSLEKIVPELLGRFSQPVLVETYLPGREFTVGITGTGDGAKSAGVLEIKFLGTAEAGAYSYTNKEECEQRIEYLLVSDQTAERAARVAIDAWRALGCRDAGRVDLRCDEMGEPHFMEVNPIAGMHPEHSDLPILCIKNGITYNDLVGEIIKNASARVKKG